MRKALAGFVYWLVGWLPLPEALEWGLSEWAYAQLNPKPVLPTHHISQHIGRD